MQISSKTYQNDYYATNIIYIFVQGPRLVYTILSVITCERFKVRIIIYISLKYLFNINQCRDLNCYFHYVVIKTTPKQRI